MKYYFCMALVMSAITNMKAQLADSPNNLQLNSASNAPISLKYHRDMLLFFGQVYEEGYLKSSKSFLDALLRFKNDPKNLKYSHIVTLSHAKK